ncbi:MAG TPA: cytochrome c-type biogenesis CcmF C-terminal domain-containing protein, partial [Ktedonobacteraceae bacterium]|nr:cytochrome c-type biogenesis CcmF C-terminal domain-containing protein [Ktedonobacteraceae bacterium]
QERRGMLKVWNLCLVVASFALSIFGTFEVRSGIISSVHSFAYSDIGSYYFVFLVIVIAFSSALFVFRLPRLRPEQEFDSVVSREGIFLLNNLLLVGIAFATLWGTLFPLLSAALSKQAMSVGAPFYERVNGPLFAILILAMGVGPLLAWRRTSLSKLWRNLGIPALAAAACAAILPLAGVRDILANVGFAVCAFTAGAILYELWRGMRVRHKHGEAYPVALYRLIQRYRQRYGGYIVHLGLVLLAVGVIGSHFFQTQQDAVLHPGQEMTVDGYQFTYLGNIDVKNPGTETITAQLQVWHNGQLQGYLYPGRTFYAHFGNQPASLIPIPNYNLTDFYVLLNDWQGAAQADIHIFVNPLTPLVWYGGILMILGGITCWWPDRRKRSHQATIRRGDALCSPVRPDIPEPITVSHNGKIGRAQGIAPTTVPGDSHDEEAVI